MMLRTCCIALICLIFACSGGKEVQDENSDKQKVDKKIKVQNKNIEQEKEPVEKKVEMFSVYQNSTIQAAGGDSLKAPDAVEVVKGDKLVFEYYFSYSHKQIPDAHKTEKIFFEVNKTSTSFVMMEEDIALHNGYYGIFCYCVSTGYFPIKSGKIKGNKISNGNWMVTLNVTVINDVGEEIHKIVTDEFKVR